MLEFFEQYKETFLYLSIPLTSAIVGWGTNVLALKMTFYPIEFIGIKPFGWQGIIPSKAKKMSGISVDLWTTKLIDVQELFSQIDPEMIARGLVTAQKIGAAIAAVPVKDTIKTAPHRVVTGTPDRSGMWAIQTPQIFRFDVLKTAHEMTSADVTDDASMVESVGGLVAIFDGSNDNIKITTPEDISFSY
jgi:hypothetical protein